MINPVIDQETYTKIPQDFAESIIVALLPRNMHQTFNVARRVARAKALLKKLDKGGSGACFVDSASYKDRNKFAAVVVDHQGRCTNCATVYTSKPEVAEQVAIALALTDDRYTEIYTEGLALCSSHCCLQRVTPARQIAENAGSARALCHQVGDSCGLFAVAARKVVWSSLTLASKPTTSAVPEAKPALPMLATRRRGGFVRHTEPTLASPKIHTRALLHADWVAGPRERSAESACVPQHERPDPSSPRNAYTVVKSSRIQRAPPDKPSVRGIFNRLMPGVNAKRRTCKVLRYASFAMHGFAVSRQTPLAAFPKHQASDPEWRFPRRPPRRHSCDAGVARRTIEEGALRQSRGECRETTVLRSMAGCAGREPCVRRCTRGSVPLVAEAVAALARLLSLQQRPGALRGRLCGGTIA
ncbi:hypothetical protein HPB51_002497 [Rhipicephalus microplus]|uniref:Tick transposon n=1 Tax=Rhipicephalus microplus TaxID=6941 RepID=A0A9J6DEH7_RHIMP|nr:hypothetical protein HPB51_002497 [Rhipicephalus microplus]